MKKIKVILCLVLYTSALIAQEFNDRFTIIYDFYNKKIEGTSINLSSKFIVPDFYSMDCPSNTLVDRNLNKKQEFLFKLDKHNRQGYGVRSIKVRSKIYSVANYTLDLYDYSYGEIYENLDTKYEAVTENKKFLVKKNRSKTAYLMFANVSGFEHLYFIANISTELIENEKLYNEFLFMNGYNNCENLNKKTDINGALH